MNRKIVLAAALLVLSMNVSAQESLSVRISSSADDAEEFIGESSVGPAGSAYLDSSDLELTRDDDGPQVVGLRFTNVAIPQGATVTDAYIQFTVDEAGDAETTLTLQGEASANAGAFTDSLQVLSSRPLTSAAVTWSPGAWESGDAGPEQRSPDISSLVQEIINRPDWQAGNALAILIRGEGKRVAESFDGSESAAPMLTVSFVSDSLGETATPAQTAEAAQTDEPASPQAPAEATPETAPQPQGETTEAAAPLEAAPAPATLSANQRRYPFSSQGLGGSLLVTDYGSGTVILTLDVRGQASGTVYGATLNTGSCGERGAFLLNLEPVRSERGSLSVTPSRVDFETLTQADLSVKLYASSDPETPIACGEVGAR